MSQILICALEFLTVIVLARILGPSAMGIYTVLVFGHSLFLKFSTLGIEVANVYFIANRKYDTNVVFGNSIYVSILLGIFASLGFAFLSWLPQFQNFILAKQIDLSYCWLLVLSTPFSLLLSFLLSIYLGQGNIKSYNKICILQSGIKLAWVLLSVIILKQGIAGAITSFVTATIITACMITLKFWKNVSPNLLLNRNFFKDSLGYGFKAYLGNLIQYFNYRLDIFIIAIYLSTSALGYYSIAVGLAEQLWLFPGAIATVLFPRVSSLLAAEANDLTPRVARFTFFILLILSLLFALFGELVITIFFGKRFLPALIPLLILLPGILTLGGAKILTADLAGRGRPQIATFASFISIVLNGALNFLLIPLWGISGAAIATTTAHTVATIIIVIAFVRISQQSAHKILFINRADWEDYKKIFRSIKNPMTQ